MCVPAAAYQARGTLVSDLPAVSAESKHGTVTIIGQSSEYRRPFSDSLPFLQASASNNNNNNNNRIQRRYSRSFTISSQRRELSPTRTLKWPERNRVQITCNTSSAYFVQVSCYVPLGTKGQLSYSV